MLPIQRKDRSLLSFIDGASKVFGDLIATNLEVYSSDETLLNIWVHVANYVYTFCDCYLLYHLTNSGIFEKLKLNESTMTSRHHHCVWFSLRGAVELLFGTNICSVCICMYVLVDLPSFHRAGTALSLGSYHKHSIKPLIFYMEEALMIEKKKN